MTPYQSPYHPNARRRMGILRVVVAGLVVLAVAPVAEAAQQSPDPQPGSAATAMSAHDEAQVQGVSWIGQQPAGNYTLQLMAAASTGPLLSYARKASLVGPLAVGGFKSGDRVLYLLLQGSYPSRDEAQSAAVRLEQEGAERPWVRRFSSLPDLFDSNAAPQGEPRPAKKQQTAVAGAAWLWSRNPLRYTIQLMWDRHAEGLRSFAATQRLDLPVAMVRVVRKGKPWYLLLAGDYASEEEALAAIGKLPEAMRGARPWPRHFAALQDQLVAANH